MNNSRFLLSHAYFYFFYIIKEGDKTYNKDWNNKLRSAKHLISYPLNKWALFYGSRDRAEADNLQNLLIRCANNMGITVAEAIMYSHHFLKIFYFPFI